MIELRGIEYGYADLPALRDVDLTVGRGESLVLIGANGSGKSTLMKVITGLLVPRSGTLTFDGEELTPKRRRDQLWMKRFHQRVGFLFQNSDSQLFCPTVDDEVAFGPRQMGLEAAEVGRRVADCLDLLGISGLGRRAPHHLSEGEKKRVALACVLATNPDVLVLDEPMNGLDPRTKRFLRDLLITLHRAGKTIIGATHDFAYVEGVFQRAVVLSPDHRILRTGPYEPILGDRDFLVAHNII